MSIEVTDLDNYAFVSTFEAIFINCGTSGSGLTDARKATLEAFVETAGNSLYISDWAADYIQGVWPTAVNWYGGSVSAAKVGNAQSLVATVVDSGLKTVLGKSTAEVFYDLGNWVIISSEGTGTSVLLSGSPHTNYAYSIKSSSPVTRTVGSKGISAFTTIAGTMEGVPLAVKFQPGGSSKGTVIYTTFHNEAQASDVTDDMGKVLKDFIFTL
ncbi:hypothetical protein A3F86_05010 [candidate division WOR-1 bacterium RIFCSPLOWO2_12_FULL_45_9]|uniref:Uncharacterized protein n=1 Tax=candidate division WOR-1 bacterium RIFCSPLOWO2_12_FULL_45_9 TaxID=1802568 RepID=A0A1F4RJD9_UNCSA|nr:MAG: hypothetical protein A3F86_05010 [candidate division WOR-1 bacterium RIFCSPLOWO2_12_FULL_45_9]